VFYVPGIDHFVAPLDEVVQVLLDRETWSARQRIVALMPVCEPRKRC